MESKEESEVNAENFDSVEKEIDCLLSMEEDIHNDLSYESNPRRRVDS